MSEPGEGKWQAEQHRNNLNGQEESEMGPDILEMKIGPGESPGDQKFEGPNLGIIQDGTNHTGQGIPLVEIQMRTGQSGHDGPGTPLAEVQTRAGTGQAGEELQLAGHGLHCRRANTGTTIQQTTRRAGKKIEESIGLPCVTSSEVKPLDKSQLMPDVGRSQVIMTVIKEEMAEILGWEAVGDIVVSHDSTINNELQKKVAEPMIGVGSMFEGEISDPTILAVNTVDRPSIPGPTARRFDSSHHRAVTGKGCIDSCSPNSETTNSVRKEAVLQHLELDQHNLIGAWMRPHSPMLDKEEAVGGGSKPQPPPTGGRTSAKEWTRSHSYPPEGRTSAEGWIKPQSPPIEGRTSAERWTRPQSPPKEGRTSEKGWTKTQFIGMAGDVQFKFRDGQLDNQTVG